MRPLKMPCSTAILGCIPLVRAVFSVREWPQKQKAPTRSGRSSFQVESYHTRNRLVKSKISC